MALVVPILRLFLLFLNVFETFKTLKPPRRSPRTGEKTPRAISQRKRDMKGCMAIWLLWVSGFMSLATVQFTDQSCHFFPSRNIQCSCAVVEGFADSTVGIVMPFYNEIKAIIYLFQIITRARVRHLLHFCKNCAHDYATDYFTGRGTHLFARHATPSKTLCGYS